MCVCYDMLPYLAPALVSQDVPKPKHPRYNLPTAKLIRFSGAKPCTCSCLMSLASGNGVFNLVSLTPEPEILLQSIHIHLAINPLLLGSVSLHGQVLAYQKCMYTLAYIHKGVQPTLHSSKLNLYTKSACWCVYTSQPQWSTFSVLEALKTCSYTPPPNTHTALSIFFAQIHVHCVSCHVLCFFPVC